MLVFAFFHKIVFIKVFSVVLFFQPECYHFPKSLLNALAIHMIISTLSYSLPDDLTITKTISK